MMQFTEEQRKALAKHAQEWIKDAEAQRDEIPLGFDEETEKELALMKIALATLMAEPIGYIHNVLNPDRSAAIFDEENRYYGRAVYTVPPVSALRLPSELEPASDADCDEFFCDGYNACLDEIKRLNATAPAVPDGWKLVPVEMTKEMWLQAHTLCDATCPACGKGFALDVTDNVKMSWEDMLAAASEKHND